MANKIYMITANESYFTSDSRRGSKEENKIIINKIDSPKDFNRNNLIWIGGIILLVVVALVLVVVYKRSMFLLKLNSN